MLYLPRRGWGPSVTRRPGSRGRRPCPGDAGRGADRAQLSPASLGNRHPGPSLCRRHVRYLHDRPRHPQDPPRLSGAGKVRRSSRGGAEPPHVPLRHDPNQGQPHRRGRLHHRRSPGSPGCPPRLADRGRGQGYARVPRGAGTRAGSDHAG